MVRLLLSVLGVFSTRDVVAFFGITLGNLKITALRLTFSKASMLSLLQRFSSRSIRMYASPAVTRSGSIWTFCHCRPRISPIRREQPNARYTQRRSVSFLQPFNA